MRGRGAAKIFGVWPGPLLNEIIVGTLGRAQRLYPLEICAFFIASGHFHLLVRAEDSERLARFMGYFNSKLAREVARSTGWRDKVFSRGYQADPRERRRRSPGGAPGLSHGCKENLVARPQDWPGVHCVTSLLTGEPIDGTWFDRTKEWEARLREETRHEHICTSAGPHCSA